MKKILRYLINLFIRLFKLKNNRIIFQSGRSKIDCSPYYIYKYIKDNNIKEYECIWLVEKGTDVSMIDKNDYCIYNSFKGLFMLGTAKYWIRSQSIGSIIKKRKNQIYIQTWHGAGNLKKSGFDSAMEKCDPSKIMPHAKEWDYLIATDYLNKDVMISSVNFKKNTLVLGNCTTDILVNANKDYIRHIKTKIGLEKIKKKIIMYAPTFRDLDLGKNSDELNVPIMKLGKLKDYIILLRMHPLISKKLEDAKLPSNFINIGWYPNIEDLFLVSDILITDYSSIIFPYMVLGKTLIMYPYDYEEYLKLRGGFYLDYKNDLPGPIAYNENDLIDILENINKINNEYKGKVKEFNKKYNILNDGHICEKFVEMLEKGVFK